MIPIERPCTIFPSRLTELGDELRIWLYRGTKSYNPSLWEKFKYGNKISYSESDRQFVRGLIAIINSRDNVAFKLNVFINEDALLGNEREPKEILEKLKEEINIILKPVKAIEMKPL